MIDFAKALNERQCEAATAPGGPILVLAAAGTGKTRTLVHRVAYLVESGVEPWRILLMTFTNRAAREMIERAAATAGDCAAAVWSGTFHSICARILRRNAALAGFTPSFRILDEEDQKKLVAEGIKALPGGGKDFPKKEIVLRAISDAANKGKSVAEVAAAMMSKVAGVDPEAFEKIAAGYAERKKALDAMDFDDLLLNTQRALENSEELRTRLQERFEHVLVDEYQDTNSIQAKIADCIAAGHRNIMAVGDDYQCIYTWRGAEMDNIMDFPKRWEGCRTIKLERNYRSVGSVLSVANSVMKGVGGQFGKTLVPARTAPGAAPRLYRGGDGRAQAAEIAALILELRSRGCAWRDIAVLYRSHYQSIDVQMTLARHNIPFRLTSGTGVFEQIHVKDALAFLRMATDSRDELSFMRLATLLPGVGDAGARKAWTKLGGRFDARDAARRDALGALLPAKAKQGWTALSAAFNAAAENIAAGESGEAVAAFCDRFYADHLRKEWDEDAAQSRLDDLDELAVQISTAPGGLDGFLADVALMTNLDAGRNDPSSDRITLSTVHQAKGMEWPAVIIPWCAAGMFPAAKSVEESRIDEERRLFYVATTRAKDFLAMFAPEYRRTPEGGVYPVDVSPFVACIPQDLLETRRVYAQIVAPQRRYGGGCGRGGYAGGRPSNGGGAQTGWKTSWRR